jgi:hypothetical protein
MFSGAENPELDEARSEVTELLISPLQSIQHQQQHPEGSGPPRPIEPAMYQALNRRHYLELGAPSQALGFSTHLSHRQRKIYGR